MTEDEIRRALHRMVDEDGDEHQEFVAAGLGEPQRQAVREALRVLERVRADFDEELDRYDARLEDAFAVLRREYAVLRGELRQGVEAAFGPHPAVRELDETQREAQAVELARRASDALLLQIARLDPIITDTNGERRCFFGCGYGSLAGLGVGVGEQFQEEFQYAHRPTCLWVRAGQEPMRRLRLHKRYGQSRGRATPTDEGSGEPPS